MKKQNEIVLGTHGEDYGSWMSMPAFYFFGALGAGALGIGALSKNSTVKKLGFAGCGLVFGCFVPWMAWCRKQYSYGGGGIMDNIQKAVVEHLDWDGNGNLLEVGCGSGPLSIRCAKTFPDAHVTGIDNWGVMWDKSYCKEACDNNAMLEGVSEQCTFQEGDARKLDFEDESFDAVVSNLVYHNIPGSNMQDLMLESLRCLKKGGSFVIQDSMRPYVYGDIEKFCQTLRDMGYEKVEVVDTATEVFGKAWKSQVYFVNDLKMIVGKK